MKNTDNREIVTLTDSAAVAQEAARRFEILADEAIAQSGRFTIALAGGNTPRLLYTLLAQAPYSSKIDWQNVFIFFGDERTVPPDHADSNFRMAAESLLNKVNLPEGNIFRMRGEDDPAEAADSYSAILQEFFGLNKAGGPAPENFPRLDLVLLGMGADGHTASLFPGTSALQERTKPVVANHVPKLNTQRLTLTAPTLNRAANVLFLITGADKAPALHEVLHGEYQPQTYPSQLVRPAQGKLVFLLDKAANPAE